MLIYHGISIILLSVLVLIVGMIKPRWILLWMDNPGRLPIAVVASVLFMIGMVMYGEGNKDKQQALAQQQAAQTAPQAAQAKAAEVPAPKP